MCQGQDWGPLHTWIDWFYRTCTKKKQHHVGIIACSVTNLSAETVLNTPINSQQKETYVRNAHKPQSGQIFSTCIVLVFLHIVSYFLFTYLKILPGIHIFSLKSYLFVCTVGKVVYQLYTYCTLVIITVIFFSCVKLNTHACQRLFKIL